MKHTPAPWDNVETDSEYHGIVIDAHELSKPASDADIQLMILAPELLKALKVVLVYADWRESNNNQMKKEYDKARAIVAKIEGD